MRSLGPVAGGSSAEGGLTISRTHGCACDGHPLEAPQEDGCGTHGTVGWFKGCPSTEKSLEDQAGLNPSQGRPDAVVDSVTERKVVPWVACDIEAVGLIETARVPVGSGERDEDQSSSG